MPGDSKILTGKRVSRIEHSDAGVTVSCEDGTSYAGDIVAGADGIHSVVRKAMQKHLNKLSPGAADKDIKGISAEFNCIFGYAEPIEGANVKVGDCRRSYGKGRSTLVLVGDDLRLYFFMFHKLDRRYWGDEIPRYSKADLDREAKKLFDVFLDDHVTFKQVWEQRLFATMTPLEESQNEHWTSERFVCVGDSIHKVCSYTFLKRGETPFTSSFPIYEEIRRGIKWRRAIIYHIILYFQQKRGTSSYFYFLVL